VPTSARFVNPIVTIDALETVMKSIRSLPLSQFITVSALAILSVGASPPSPLGPLPDRVTFASADGQTNLVGYVFKPEGPHAARSPAVVMMHGRAGAYSSLANGKYDATTLSQRHQKWGHLWAQQGYSPSWSTDSARAIIRKASAIRIITSDRKA
jgi:hypothetical protein